MVTPRNRSRSLPLILAISAVAAVAALAPSKSWTTARAEPAKSRSQSEAAEDTSPPSWAHATPTGVEAESVDDAAPAGATLRGKVAEQLDVANYSYLRLSGDDGGDTWVAVPATPSRLGAQVSVTNAQLMTSFVSASLRRTFDEIYFGVLDDAPDSTRTAHVPSDSGMAVAEADPHSPQQAPHPGAGRGADAVPVVASERAPGPLGRTVAELHGLGAGAAGAQARVRGTVVKVTSGVLGRTFVHLRDGTGVAPLSNDLTVTTTEELTVGSQVLLEGTLKLDEDFGSGYRYPVLLADARVVTP
jgi:hypothetical protein